MPNIIIMIIASNASEFWFIYIYNVGSQNWSEYSVSIWLCDYYLWFPFIIPLSLSASLQVSASQLNPPVHKAQLLLLAENATEKSKWIKALTELRKIIQKNLLADRSVFRVKEVISNPPVPLPKVQCADIIGQIFLIFFYLFWRKDKNLTFL